MLPNDRHRLGSGEFVARRRVVVGKNVEVFSNKLFPARESVAAAHRVIMPDRICVHEGAAVVASSADNIGLAGITLS